MTLAQLAAVLECSGTFPDRSIRGYCIDSRHLQKGELFIALKGERVDGHDFLEEVCRKGAAAAVVSKSYQGRGPGFPHDPGFPLLAVDDPLVALQGLAKHAICESSSRVVAITGSVGKTTTKEFIKTLLAKKYRVAATPGNSNSQVGIPLALLNQTTGDEEVLVLEMGMSVPGNLARLVQIVPPEVAVITNVALVHACNFDSIEEIAWAKAEILSQPVTRLAILYRHIPEFEKISAYGACHKISFSMDSLKADYSLDPTNPRMLQDRMTNQAIEIGPLPVPGTHNLHNFLAAVAVARYFDVTWEQIQGAIPKLSLPQKRLQLITRNGVQFLNDAYNASEMSVKAALETLPAPEGKGRKIAVLGSMMELGKFSDECHLRVGEHALDRVDQMFCLGEECLPIQHAWKIAGRSAMLFATREELVAALKETLSDGDVVLLKGSRSKELWKVLDEI